uniref:HAT C-terminal dimerisation domain-containing protein n=1 Tax=Cajanus cajan TaxID=3821 RepID=A0A151QR10_CAJCA|nr:hypothetical protein KK1_046477 [Cajanus cajan]
MFGDHCPKLKGFSIRVLSLTCSSSRCERNWSSFEIVHTKRGNRLHLKKMNDLVYVMYNLKLKSKVIRKTITLPFDDIQSDDEWIVEERDNVGEENVDVECRHPISSGGIQTRTWTSVMKGRSSRSMPTRRQDLKGPKSTS